MNGPGNKRYQSQRWKPAPKVYHRRCGKSPWKPEENGHHKKLHPGMMHPLLAHNENGLRRIDHPETDPHRSNPDPQARWRSKDSLHIDILAPPVAETAEMQRIARAMQ